MKRINKKQKRSLSITNVRSGSKNPITKEKDLKMATMEETNKENETEICSICHGKFINKSKTGSCCHEFCFKCISQWVKIKPNCPLCIQNITHIHYNFMPDGTFKTYCILALRKKGRQRRDARNEQNQDDIIFIAIGILNLIIVHCLNALLISFRTSPLP